MTTIRPYLASDHRAMNMVYFRAIREGAVSAYPEAELATWASTSEPDFEKPDKLLDQWAWVAEEGGRMTGFMSLCHDGLLDMAFVIPEAMGKGTAGLLYDTLLAKTQEQGLTVSASAFSRCFLTKRGWKFEKMQQFEENGMVFETETLSLDLSKV